MIQKGFDESDGDYKGGSNLETLLIVLIRKELPNLWLRSEP